MRILGTHEEYKEMIAAQALGALEAAEARELEAHLATCAECRAESDAMQETAACLAYLAPPVAPSAELHKRLLASVRAEDGLRPSARVVAKENEEMRDRGIESSARGSNVIPFERPARRSWSAASMVGALAASLAFVALAVSLVMLWNRYNATQSEVAQLTNRLEQTQEQLQRERTALAREREVKDLLAAPEAHIMSLAGTEMATSAHARFVFDGKTGRAMLMAEGLPPAPAGKAYQLWYIAAGKPPMPGQVFNPDAAGHAEMRDQLPEEARSATVFAVTLEPSGGVNAPTGPKYLLGAAS